MYRTKYLAGTWPLRGDHHPTKADPTMKKTVLREARVVQEPPHRPEFLGGGPGSSIISEEGRIDTARTGFSSEEGARLRE